MEIRPGIPVHEKGFQEALEALRREMHALHLLTRSWREVGRKLGISKPQAYRIAHGDYIPRSPKLCRKLGLPVLSARVRPIDGAIPDGTQALGARSCVRCGASFISNHPRRKRCYACSRPRQKANN